MVRCRSSKREVSTPTSCGTSTRPRPPDARAHPRYHSRRAERARTDRRRQVQGDGAHQGRCPDPRTGHRRPLEASRSHGTARRLRRRSRGDRASIREGAGPPRLRGQCSPHKARRPAAWSRKPTHWSGLVPTVPGFAASARRSEGTLPRMAMPTVEDVRTEVKTWLEENWDPDLKVGEWWDVLARSGYAAPTFPEDCWGKGWPRDLAMAVSDAIKEHGAIGPPAGLGYLLAAPTIVAHGNERQKREELLAHPQRSRRVVSVVLRTRCRLRPRKPLHEGREGRRRVDHHRPEGVDVHRAADEPRHADRAHGSRAAEAQGHHVLQVRHASTRRRDPAACAR